MRTIAVLVAAVGILTVNGCGDSPAGGGGGGRGGGGGGATGSGGRGGAAGGTAGSGGASGSAGTGGGGGGAGIGAGGTGGAAGGTAGSGGASGSTGTGGAGGSGTCGTSTDPSTGSGCNTVEATGACVTETLGAGSAPSPAGGTIVAGTYDLTSMVRYASADGGNNTSDDRRQTLVISSVIGGSFALQITQVSGTTVERQAGGVIASGTQVTFTPTCPIGGNGGGSAGYTATSTTFTLFDMTNGGDLRLSVFTKR
jgi:hypothetical protein